MNAMTLVYKLCNTIKHLRVCSHFTKLITANFSALEKLLALDYVIFILVINDKIYLLLKSLKIPKDTQCCIVI